MAVEPAVDPERMLDRPPGQRKDEDRRDYDRSGVWQKRSRGAQRTGLHGRGDRAWHDARDERSHPRVEGAPGQCPRHPRGRGFVADAFVAQRVADCAVLVLHAQDPIQVVTERVWRRGEREGIPHVIVVNHLDRERTDFGVVVEQLRARFGQVVVPLNLPIGRENDLRGVYGLLSGTAFVDGEQTNEIPEGMEDEVDEAKIQLFEAIAESDDTLLEKYLEGEELSTEEAFEGISKGIADGVIIPVLAASAEPTSGWTGSWTSSPAAPRARWTARADTEEDDEIPCDPDGPFAAYVFKTNDDPYAGRLSVLRVVSGVAARTRL